FWNDNRQHRTSDDPGLDESAGVQSSDSRAVEDGIEVIGTRIFVNGIAAPHHRIKRRDVDRFPLCHAGGMWSYEYADIAKRRIAARAQVPNPFDDEWSLRRAPVYQRRAHPQRERPRRIEADPIAELLP